MTAFLLGIAAKSGLILTGAWLATTGLRRRSAAVRHLVWTLAIVSALVLPVLSLALPQVEIPVLSSTPPAWSDGDMAEANVPGRAATELMLLEPTGRAGAVVEDETPGTPQVAAVSGSAGSEEAPTGNSAPTPGNEPNGWSWSFFILILWCFGAAAGIAVIIAGLVRVRGLTREGVEMETGPLRGMLDVLAREIGISSRVVLLQSPLASVPMTWGVFRPRIALPFGAAGWPSDRLRIVLLHELAHIRRMDYLTQLLAQFVRSVYWFNPLAWLAVRQLRIERERASDDAVLGSGQGASDYAECLVRIAHNLRTSRRIRFAPAAVAMARPSGIEGRVRSILDGRVRRGGVNRGPAAVLTVCSLLAASLLAAGGFAADTVWQGGKESVARKAYEMHRLERTIDTWGNMARDAKRDREGKLVEPYPVFLVIDLNKSALWVESWGKVLEPSVVHLPATGNWRLKCMSPGNTEDLPPIVRLNVRGLYTDSIFPESFYLIGDRPGGGHRYIQIEARGVMGSGSGSGSFNMPTIPSTGEVPEENYGSILVGAAEYEQVRRMIENTGATPEKPGHHWPGYRPVIQENRKRWLEDEERIWAEIEKQILDAGYRIRSFVVNPGPDYSAGHAKIGVWGQKGFLGLFGGGGPPLDIIVKLDLVGDGVWYANAEGFHNDLETSSVLPEEMGFLIGAPEDLSDSEREDLIEEGRKKQQQKPTLPDEWAVDLPNGATVQFIGITETPAGSAPWWGPDGSELDIEPYVRREPVFDPRPDRRIVEIAWRVRAPRGLYATGASFDLCLGSGYRRIYDRYGLDDNTYDTLVQDVEAEAYQFPSEMESTTLRIGVGTDKEDREWVAFKNIALTPGKDFGFEIVTGDEAEK